MKKVLFACATTALVNPALARSVEKSAAKQLTEEGAKIAEQAKDTSISLADRQPEVFLMS
jgi:hypothetical protein